MAATFASATNCFAKIYQSLVNSRGARAFHKKPLQMTIYTLCGGITGIAGGIISFELLWAMVSSLPKCGWGQYILDNAYRFNCTVSGDPCPPRDGKDGSAKGPALQNIGSSPADHKLDLTYNCGNGQVDIDRLNGAADSYVANLKQENINRYESGWVYALYTLPIVGFVVGAYLGYRIGLKRAEPSIAEDLLHPFLGPEEKNAAAQATLATTSSLYSPTNPQRKNHTNEPAQTLSPRVPVSP